MEDLTKEAVKTAATAHVLKNRMGGGYYRNPRLSHSGILNFIPLRLIIPS